LEGYAKEASMRLRTLGAVAVVLLCATGSEAGWLTGWLPGGAWEPPRAWSGLDRMMRIPGNRGPVKHGRKFDDINWGRQPLRTVPVRGHHTIRF
jgi:hypothetical protein